MATREFVPVLAVANQRLQVRNDLELDEVTMETEDGVITQVQETWVPVFVDAGTVIQVGDWANVDAYVSRGQITLLGPADAKAAWAEMQAEEAAKAKTAQAAKAQAVKEPTNAR
jgi:hypothetical protein